ncbi:DNA primase [Streptomyces sp. CHD11]|uniref:DNA primase n=1 Tax=Streptomyces sp. CHD11 TaxID=2741325 RepID=UPI001BFCCC84|nr:DNA primase [Streptomyces sp. CHD11]MBT3154162.1 DNA primase [Streptomyces sp. CHD11]
MNRMGMGLAIGAGYLLGRTKKLKMAVAVGGLVAGKKLNLSPRMVADLLSRQLRDNPQFKELGDQLRGDLRGVGKAASGALVERQLGSLADRLHGRTAEMREELSGGGRRDRAQDAEDAEDADGEPEDREDREDAEDREEEPAPERPAKKAAAKKAPAKKAGPAKKAAAKRTAPAKKAAAKKSAPGPRAERPRTSKGGGER